MSRPRFLLVTGRRTSATGSPRWPDAWGPHTGNVALDGSWIAWRVAGANNRELGRSAGVFPDVERCLGDARALQDGVTDAESIVAMDHMRGGWTWRLDLHGRVAAVAARTYSRERECRYGLDQFVASIVGATLEESARAVPQRPVGGGGAG